MRLNPYWSLALVSSLSTTHPVCGSHLEAIDSSREYQVISRDNSVTVRGMMLMTSMCLRLGCCQAPHNVWDAALQNEDFTGIKYFRHPDPNCSGHWGHKVSTIPSLAQAGNKESGYRKDEAPHTQQTSNQVNDLISIHYSGFLTDKAVSPAPKLRSTCLSLPRVGVTDVHATFGTFVVGGGWLGSWVVEFIVCFIFCFETDSHNVTPSPPHPLLCSSSGYPMPLLLSPGVTWTIGMQHCARHSCLVGWELLAKHHR